MYYSIGALSPFSNPDGVILGWNPSQDKCRDTMCTMAIRYCGPNEKPEGCCPCTIDPRGNIDRINRPESNQPVQVLIKPAQSMIKPAHKIFALAAVAGVAAYFLINYKNK